MPVDVTDQSFASDVIEESKGRPVLVDFWAEWCGPCRMLTPVLEKLERDFAGRFRLAKVNTDHNPGTAAEYRISGIPAVKLFHSGRIVDEFVGALPEAQVRGFLERHLPDPALEGAAELAASSPQAAAGQVLEQGLSGEAAEGLLWQGALAALATQPMAAMEAQRFVSAIPEAGSKHSAARNALLGFLERGAEPERLAQIAQLLNGPEQAGPVLEAFLAAVRESSGNERDAARADLVACFALLGNQGELVDGYRRKLSSALF